jgi:hypothetical protein
MSRLEDTTSARQTEGTGHGQPADWHPDREIQERQLGGDEVRELPPTNQLGYKDASCREFRMQHETEYLEPMTRTRPVERFVDPRECCARINPDYDRKNPSYTKNCADCARCFERSWRGHEEEAAGRAAQPEGRNWAVTGESSERTEEWSGESFAHVHDASTVKSQIEKAGHGASGIVHARFLDSEGDAGGHAYNIVNHQGRVSVVDSQSNEVLDWDDHSIHPKLPRTFEIKVMMWDKEGRRIL